MNEATGTGFPVTLLYALLATALVLVLAWFSLRMLGRVMNARPHRPGRLSVVQTLPLGTRERVVVLRDETSEYVLGVTAGGINLLERRDRPPEPESTDPTH